MNTHTHTFPQSVSLKHTFAVIVYQETHYAPVNVWQTTRVNVGVSERVIDWMLVWVCVFCCNFKIPLTATKFKAELSILRHSNGEKMKISIELSPPWQINNFHLLTMLHLIPTPLFGIYWRSRLMCIRLPFSSFTCIHLHLKYLRES